MRRLTLTMLVLLLPCLPVLAQNPVTNGSFEEVAATGLPVDWEFVGPTVKVVPTAHTGKNALLFTRASADKNEVGLNREWKVNSGQQGKMLAERKGGLEFWYQALSADPKTRMGIGVIAMTSEPNEGTGERRTYFEVPQSQVGDGQWHRGLVKYDFSGNPQVKWVHVAARLQTGGGQFLLDDIKWVPTVGPLPKVQKVSLTETPGQEGESCTVRAQVTNAGDAPMQAAQATLTVPAYLKILGDATREVPATAPDAVTVVEWQVTGLRDRADSLRVTLTSDEQTAEGTLALAPELEVEQLRADRFLLTPGESTPLKLIVINHGNAAVRGAVARLVDSPATQAAIADRAPVTLDLIRPGGTASAGWTATLKQVAPSVPIAAELVVDKTIIGKAAVALVCAPAMPELPAMGGGAYARLVANVAVVGNETLRLVIARSAGPSWLQVNRGGKWETMAVLPQLASLATSPASGGEGNVTLPITSLKATGGGKTASLSLIGGTAAWPVTWTISCDQGADILNYALTLTPAADGNLYGLHGPMLYVGEGGWGGKKTEAVLPGLEWLVGDEVSSSTLDIDASMPQRWRWCPPPHSVTIPAMSVYHAGVTVGLLWDQLQAYTPGETRPRAIFGAPDRFEGRNASLLGLMIPGGPDPEYWVPPRLATEKPWAVKKGQPVTLKAQLYAKTGTTDALSAMDRWFALYGAPEPERLPHGKTWNDEISLSALAYTRSLWDPKASKWFAYLNGPNTPTTRGLHAAYLYDTLYASRLASDPTIKQECLQKVEEVRQLGGPKPSADDEGFEFGDPAGALIGRAEVVSSVMNSQNPDGSWRFRTRIEKTGIFAGMDYAELGPDNAAEVGTCANNAHQILTYARMTGDPEATAAGIRALEFMKQFTVPRAAQVWEVPVHTPDVLASADACEAYLEGYEITGKPEYLQRAVFWARTGLPFIYMWDTPNYEMLRYASIPVMGASWYTCNWFGQPVQWNGLRLARAYTRLAALDKSYPWRKIAEGITVSCMWQQHGKQVSGPDLWPDTNEKWTGLWPDNFNSVDLKRCPWVFAPRAILDLVYRFMDMQPEPQTAVATQDGKALRISACAKITGAQWQGDRLSASLQCTPPQATQILVTNIARPASVSINGVALTEVPRLPVTEGAGWLYQSGSKLLYIRPGADNALKLEIAGARYEPGRVSVATATKLDFAFDTDSDGFRPAHDLTDPVVKAGIVQMNVTGSDPYFVRNNCDFAADAYQSVLVRLAVSPKTVGDLQVFWGTSDSRDFDEAKSARVPLIADGQFHDYQMPVGQNPQWKGRRITSLRIDPGSGPADTEVQFDLIRGLP